MFSTVNHLKPIVGKLTGSGGEPIDTVLLMDIVSKCYLHLCLYIRSSDFMVEFSVCSGRCLMQKLTIGLKCIKYACLGC